LPKWNKKVNKDVLSFIKFFLGKGVRVNQPSLLAVVRHFHLAFKCMDTEEVYDVLMQQLIKAIHKYDPKYTEKVKAVSEVIDNLNPAVAAVGIHHLPEAATDCS